MKKLLKIIGGLVVVIVLALVAGATHLWYAFPKVEASPELTVERTPQRVERGKYLANHVTVCVDCHSQRDWTKFSGPIIDGTYGQGGEIFDEKVGFPGVFVARNITPYNLSNWKDGEIMRAIASGVNRQGEPFFPVMPYLYYNKLDKEDVMSIIAYVRSLSPLKNDPPASHANFPMNLIMRTIPEPPHFTQRPPAGQTPEYGKYVANAAACMECHTKQDKGKQVGPQFGGGFEFRLPGGIVRSANITPDKTAGIGGWSKADFIKRFKGRDIATYKPEPVDPKGFNTPMPWTMYGGMTEEDLGAIYEYLRTVAPSSEIITKFSPDVTVAK